MKFVLPVTKTFKLNTDPDGVAEIVIRQANNGDQTELDRLSEEQKFRDNPIGGRDLVIKWNASDRIRLKVSRVLAGATGFLSEDDKEILEFRAGANGQELVNKSKFNELWNRIPVEMADEIYQYVLDVNPQWDESLPGK